MAVIYFLLIGRLFSVHLVGAPTIDACGCVLLAVAAGRGAHVAADQQRGAVDDQQQRRRHYACIGGALPETQVCMAP